jgi:hypothetical protein
MEARLAQAKAEFTAATAKYANSPTVMAELRRQQELFGSIEEGVRQIREAANMASRGT